MRLGALRDAPFPFDQSGGCLRSPDPPWLRRWAVVFGVWTLAILLVATQMVFRLRSSEDPVTWQHALLLPMAYWYGWALWTPVIFAGGRRTAPRTRGWPTAIAAQLAIALFICLVMLWWYAFLMHHLGGESRSVQELFVVYLAFGFHYDVLTYAAILGAGYARDYRGLFEQRTREAQSLEGKLVQTQLEVLRMQLRPHFLFNTLHAIASLVEDDPSASKRMIARLSGLLRHTLDLGDRHEITLREELEVLDDYLEIEKCRFGDRLTIARDFDSSCMPALVPSLLLQPLVENAIRYGTQPSDGTCRLELGCVRSEDALVLRVRDHGPGPGAQPRDDTRGIGLANVRSRLRQMYPDRSSLELVAAAGAGTIVQIRLPFLTSDDRREQHLWASSAS